MTACGNCGKPLKAGAQYCTFCGAAVSAYENVKTRQMHCASCGASLELSDENEQILFCPFCGSKELILESDEVVIEKDRNRTFKEIKLDEHKMIREIELERLRFDKELSKAAYDEEGRRYRHGAWSKITFVLMAVYAFGLSLCFTGVAQKQGLVWPPIIAVIQIALCVLTYLLGARVIRNPISRLWPLLLAISVVLIFIFISAR